MVLYDKIGNPKLYDSGDLVKIARLISGIQYADGFIKAVIWEENPSEANSNLAKHNAQEAIKDIKKYEEITPEEIKKQFDFNELEEICKKLLKK